MKNILIEIKWFFLALYCEVSELFEKVSQKLFAPPLVRETGYIKHEEAPFTEWEMDSTTYDEVELSVDKILELDLSPYSFDCLEFLNLNAEDWKDMEQALEELELNVKHQGL